MGIAFRDPPLLSTFSRTVRILWNNPFLYPIETIFWRLPEAGIVHAVILAVWSAGVAGIFLWRRNAVRDAAAASGQFRRFAVCFCLTHLIVMALVYALFFHSSRWFIQRYLYPATALTVPVTLYLAWSMITAAGFPLTPGKRRTLAVMGLAYATFFMMSGVRWYRLPANDELYDFAMYLRQTFPGKSIAMLQSGTVGFFVDKVTNLDGKVNFEIHPYLQEKRVIQYLTEKKFDVIADWPRLIDPIMINSRLEPEYTNTRRGPFSIFVKREAG
jgi:hypothetical protein